MSYRSRVKQAELEGQLEAQKVFNVRTVSDTVDQVIAMLGKEAEREPEIQAAVGTLLATKRLLKTYSQRLLNSPNKTVKKR